MPGHHRWFREHFSRGFGILVVGDDLPQASNRVTLSETMKDSSGLPAAHIHYRLHENDERLMRAFGIDRALDIAKAADAIDIKVNAFARRKATMSRRPGTLLGTARMGADPASSVVNRWHQAWDVPNLYVVDGSSMPSGAAVNPTSTISAMALRAAENIAANFSTLRTLDRPIAA